MSIVTIHSAPLYSKLIPDRNPSPMPNALSAEKKNYPPNVNMNIHIKAAHINHILNQENIVKDCSVRQTISLMEIKSFSLLDKDLESTL